MATTVSDEMYAELLRHVRNELQKQFLYFPVFERAHPLSEDIVSFVTGRSQGLMAPLSGDGTHGHAAVILNALKARAADLPEESMDKIRAIEAKVRPT